MIEDNDLLDKYNTTWDKISADIKNEMYSKPDYNINYLKAKKKSHDNEVPNFYDKKIRL